MAGVKGMKSKRRKLCGAARRKALSYAWLLCCRKEGHPGQHRNSVGLTWDTPKT